RVMIQPQIKQVTLSKELEVELFERDHEHLLQLRFSKYPCIIYGVKESYYRESAKIFWPLRYALYASGALFVKDDQVPNGIADRLELVNLFLQKAQSFNFAENCTPLTVLTLETICNACYQLNSTQEAILYFKFALQHARICKINSEAGIAQLSVFDYERENIRRIWWILFRDFSNFSKLIGYDAISHQENNIFLPSSNFYFESESSNAFYGMEIMRSDSWYIPSFGRLEIEDHYLMILKIQAKMYHYFEIELSSDAPQLCYCAGAINASLNDWYTCFSEKFEQAMFLIQTTISENQEMSWLTIYIALIYCSVRINLLLPTFMRNVIKGKRVLKQLYFQEAVETAKLSAVIVQLIVRYNPGLEHFAGAALMNIFPSGFFLLCCSKLKIEKTDVSYQIILGGIKQACLAFQKLNQFYQVLKQLEEKELVDAKRKCDRNQPCAFCESRKIACRYSKQEDFEKHLEGVEQRIKHMEEVLFSPYNTVYQNKDKRRPLIKQIQLTKLQEKELFHTNHDHLLDLRFEKFPCVIFGITEEYYRQSVQLFWPLRFALYACGALFIGDDQLPKDINSTEEASIYFRQAIQHARICQINSEEGISKITIFDYERENIRRLWWLLFRDFSNVPQILGRGTIENKENQIFLPSNNFYFESATALDYYGIEIMSNNEWYTPTVPNLEIEGYHCILQAIQLKVHYHNQTESTDVLPSFMRSVINRKDVTKLLYFKEAMTAAASCTQIIQLIIQYNPKLEYFATAALFALFPCGFMLLCGIKLHLESVDEHYNILLAGIKQFSWAFQKLNQFQQLLSMLEEKDLIDIVIYYGIFITRQHGDLIESPAVNHKRKCDRKQPCTFCVSKHLNCKYTQQKQFEEHLENVEQRIKLMEQKLLNPSNNIVLKREKVRPTIKHINLTADLHIELFEKPQNHLLDLRFQKFPSIIFGITEQYYRESAKIFWPLRFALYASGSLFLTPHQVPFGISDRIELVNLYLQKAQSFNFAEKCDHLTILALEIIANTCYHINSTDEAVVYFKFALQQALICGINNENELYKLSPFDYERENIRRTWWLLYRNYTTLCKLLGYGAICDADNQIFLPSARFYFESAYASDYYGIEIMSSREWYTATIPCQEVEAYHIILQRIQSKMFHHFEIELSENNLNSFYSAGAINASLLDWMHLFSPNLHQAFSIIRKKQRDEQEYAWLVVYTAFIFCSIRVNLIIPTFMRNVIKGKDVQKQLYFKEAMDAAVTCTNLVQIVMQYNPELEYFAAAVLLTLFPTAFHLLCCAKLGIPNSEDHYKFILNGIKLFSRAFQKLNQFYNVLLLLESKDLLETVIYYGIFITRQNSELMERPSAQHF
ncbi:hypothetical protein HDV06_005211, partial [Boothiomyces sp. JEL0866]